MFSGAGFSILSPSLRACDLGQWLSRRPVWGRGGREGKPAGLPLYPLLKPVRVLGFMQEFVWNRALLLKEVWKTLIRYTNFRPRYPMTSVQPAPFMCPTKWELKLTTSWFFMACFLSYRMIPHFHWCNTLLSEALKVLLVTYEELGAPLRMGEKEGGIVF